MIRTSPSARRAVIAAVAAAVLAIPAVAAAQTSGPERDLQTIDLRCAPVDTDRGPAAHCAWEAPDGAVGGYALQRRDHRGDRRMVAHGGADFRSHVDGPLRPGRYEYVVAAFDEERQPMAVSRPATVTIGKDRPHTTDPLDELWEHLAGA